MKSLFKIKLEKNHHLDSLKPIALILLILMSFYIGYVIGKDLANGYCLIEWLALFCEGYFFYYFCI